MNIWLSSRAYCLKPPNKGVLNNSSLCSIKSLLFGIPSPSLSATLFFLSGLVTVRVVGVEGTPNSTSSTSSTSSKLLQLPQLPQLLQLPQLPIFPLRL
ncbi:hypothetical protein Glove_499g48 [Diversispora epigaea]|uniref:Uncharacterized protein n=1 Tax=Diversispora epigaea TaxID=1348612 RepID=A0A397GKZ9_9GLOM|nr:hypothetical protein Glove_499g48 [Diversispora epigaea]